MTKKVLIFTIAALAVLFVVQGVCAATPFITPTTGDVGTPFTITDPEGRIQPGDICLFYEWGTPAELGIPVMDVSITGGTILSGTVPVRLSPGLFGVTVRESADAFSRFPDLEFSVSPCIPTTEVCDGIDNNCNGIIDECPVGETCIGGTCTTAPNVPEFPSLFIPLITIIGFVGAVLLIKGFRDH